jgi:hypothetical protein
MATTPRASRTLLRFPGPLALLKVLGGERPTLHHADAPRVFLGDHRLWDWPDVRSFGALAVLDADRFEPVPHDIEGWYTCAVVPLGAEDAVYVPDAECAGVVTGCRTARTARRRLTTAVPDLAARVAQARAAMVAYDADAAAVDAARSEPRAAALPAPLRALLNRPLHLLEADERRRLVAALR